MQPLDGAYWRKRMSLLVPAGVCGFGYIALLMRIPAHYWGYIWLPVVPLTLCCAPFTLKTAIGRLWWGAYGTLLVSGGAAVLLGSSNPLSWFFAVVAGCAYAIGICLRWSPVSGGYRISHDR